MSTLFIALLHHPVLDAEGRVCTTSVTSLDIHDLARSARTYNCAAYFIVQPIDSQRELVQRVVDHWVQGSGGKRIPDRVPALDRVRVVATLDDALRHAEALAGAQRVESWVTSAQSIPGALGWTEARARLSSGSSAVMLVFGTGWGLAPDVVERADVALAPLDAEEDAQYNHLSVRAACAVALDRLRGDRT